ncbi:MAG: hypothetical protein LBJ00_18800 [Planctomycetaceae bacterium]|nr:hypothetical protein [Planctomycetaceae bacterium]
MKRLFKGEAHRLTGYGIFLKKNIAFVIFFFVFWKKSVIFRGTVLTNFLDTSIIPALSSADISLVGHSASGMRNIWERF